MRFKVFMVGLALAAMGATAASAQTQERPRRTDASVQLGPRTSMIGVRLSDVTAESAKTLKLEKVEGAVAEAVDADSPAAKAGVRERDVIVAFDGERVRSASHLSRLVRETPAGREVPMTVMRDGTRVDLRITPETRRAWFDEQIGGVINSEEWRERMERAARNLRRRLPEAMEDMREGMGMSRRSRLGVSVQPLSGELAEYFGVKAGVLVASVVSESPAAAAGLKAGDVITAVDGKPVASPGELVRAIPTTESSRELSLTVTRDRKEMTLKAVIPAQPPSAGRQRVALE